MPEGAVVTNSDISTGITIKDSNENEWVWIIVPKSIFTTATSSTDYTNIEADMKTYTAVYKSSTYSDVWYSEAQAGIASSADYITLKNKMLTSVYTNGGFYIGKYEVGTETKRTAKTDPETTAVIKQDAYPYNHVTCEQSQTLATGLATGGKTSTLMFGVQWDLVLKYLEENATKLGTTKLERQTKLKNDSSTWGNYSNISFDVTRGSWYSPWTAISGAYTKPVSTSKLLTTGATERNSVLNIYDLAGNVWEWNLEYTSNSDFPCSGKGGNYNNGGSDYPASYRNYAYTTSSNSFIGFRPALL